MAKMTDIDGSKRISLYPMMMRGSVMDLIAGLNSITLKKPDTFTFLSCVTESPAPADFERDLQCISNDAKGKPLLTTWVPITIFREDFCGHFMQSQNDQQRALCNHIFGETMIWEPSGCEFAVIEGYRIKNYSGN